MLTPFVPCLLSALGRLTFSPLCQSKRKKRGDKHRALTQGRDQFLGEEWGRALSSHAQPGGTHCLVIGSESRILSDRTVARKSSAMPCTCLQCCACGSCSSAQSFRLFWWPFIIGEDPAPTGGAGPPIFRSPSAGSSRRSGVPGSRRFFVADINCN
jgi:hypothetical protein